MRLSLTSWIFIAVIIGGLLGLFAPAWVPAISIFGDIFKYGLMMLIIPLVVTSMISGIASLGDVRKLGRLGLTSMAYYLTTTLVAVLIGLSLVNLLQPGVLTLPAAQQEAIASFSSTAQPPNEQDLHALVTRLQLERRQSQDLYAKLKSVAARGFIEDDQSLKKLCHEQLSALLLRRSLDAGRSVEQRSKDKKKIAGLVAKPKTWGDFARDQVRSILQNPIQAMANRNILAVIFFALLLGGALTTLGERGRLALNFFSTLNEAVMKLVGLVMWMAPLGVMALIAEALAQGGFQALKLLGAYSLVVVLGLSLHAGLVLPTVLALLTKRKPWSYAAQLRPALAISFSTASSAATLPVSMQSVENAGVNPRVSGFVLPLGATINMDGTALYEAVAALFIAQVYGVSLSPGQQIVVFLTAVLAAIGAAAIPSAGTVTMAMVLAAVGLPIEGIGLILAVDRFLDMLRTSVNVWGDVVGAAVIEKLAPLAFADKSTTGADI